MIEEEMVVGPKGQVVIPVSLRRALKIRPGSKVVFRLEGDKIVLSKPRVDAAAVFEEIAKSGDSIAALPEHLYEDEIAGRLGAERQQA